MQCGSLPDFDRVRQQSTRRAPRTEGISCPQLGAPAKAATAQTGGCPGQIPLNFNLPSLVKARVRLYSDAMLKPSLFAAALLCVGLPALADTIQLKDKAAVTGQILAEKRDS